MPSPLRRKRDLERKEATRQRLLDAAARVFAERGYHATLVSDIVGAAGVGQGTFYRCFDSKRAIFETLLDRFVDELLAQFAEMRARPPTNLHEYRDASKAVALGLGDKLDTHRELVRMLLRETRAIDRDSEERMAGLLDRFAQVAKFYLDHAIRLGFARPCNSEVVAHALVGIALRLVELRLDSRLDRWSVTELSDQVVDFAFLGFGGQE